MKTFNEFLIEATTFPKEVSDEHKKFHESIPGVTTSEHKVNKILNVHQSYSSFKGEDLNKIQNHFKKSGFKIKRSAWNEEGGETALHASHSDGRKATIIHSPSTKTTEVETHTPIKK